MMRRHTMLGFFVTCVGLVACPNFDAVCTDPSCLDGGSDTDVAQDAPQNCDLSKDPKDSLACVDDSVGVFVDATKGVDTNTGVRASPVKTITRALAIAGSKSRIYACAGTYSEDVAITAANDGESLYGGWDCPTWTYANGKTIIGKSSTALTISAFTKPGVIEDVTIQAGAGTTDGASSIAVFVNASTVTFKRAVLTASNGKSGTPGTKPSNYTQAAQTGGNGTAGGGTTALTCNCTDTTSSTGGGGGGLAGGGGDGTATPAIGVPNGGLGGASSCTDGDAGAGGVATAPGTAALINGAINANGWDRADAATAGKNGHPGQGGGGGGGKSIFGGGGGGCGGCGGAGGTQGMNGGSSIALVAFNATVTFVDSNLNAANGGDGGKGGDGQDGEAAGGGGIGACNGGSGGAGAGGSGGGGGAGGHALGVAYVGSAPQLTNTPVVTGTAGSKGKGGLAGGSTGNAGQPGADSVDGKKQDALLVQ